MRFKNGYTKTQETYLYIKTSPGKVIAWFGSSCAKNKPQKLTRTGLDFAFFVKTGLASPDSLRAQEHQKTTLQKTRAPVPPQMISSF